MERSLTIRRTIASCCASFSPKNAMSGVAMLKSLQTTVHTPRKCIGLVFPQSCFGISDCISTYVAKPSGYISSTEGWKTMSQPSRSSIPQSRAKSRGYVARSSLGANCVGLTNTEATVLSQRRTDSRTRLACPSCRYPIVGTRPTFSPCFFHSRTCARTSSIVSAIITAAFPLKFRVEARQIFVSAV